MQVILYNGKFIFEILKIICKLKDLVMDQFSTSKVENLLNLDVEIIQ